MEKTFFLKNKENYNIPIILNEFANKKEIVIMVHGFFSEKTSRSYLDFSSRLNVLKIPNIRFDFYGHGENNSNLANITITKVLDELDIIVEYIKKEGYGNIILLGTSFGGEIASIIASRRDDVIALALKCPVTNYINNLNEKKDIIKWKKEGKINYNPGFGSRGEINYTFYEDCLNYDFENLLKNITCPTQIVHGNADLSVNVTQSIKADKLICNSQLIIINGADHQFKKERDKKVCHKVLLDFIKEHIKNG